MRHNAPSAVLGVGAVLVAVVAIVVVAWASRSLAGAGPLTTVVAAAVAATAAHVAGRSAHRTAPAVDAAPTPPLPAERSSTDADGVEPDRVDALLTRVLEVRDLLENPALASRLDTGLVAAGYELVDPVPGTPFDADHHQAVDTAPTDVASEVGAVASVEQVGVRHGAHLVRRASVVVWRQAP